MAAALLTADDVMLHNLPYVRDIITMRRLLEDIGAHVLTPELRPQKISVTGTENLMMAAALADGRTTLHHAAREPEVSDLAELLNKMGARVRGAGTSTIEIDGVESLGGAEHAIIPDRIETGTFIVAAAIARGELEIKNCNPEHCRLIIGKLRESGVEIEELNQSTAMVRGPRKPLKACDVTTEEYPGF